MAIQNRSFAQYLHFRNFEVTQALKLNKIPGFVKPSLNDPQI
ncbi:MAG TPA: hypothetical protein VKA34_19110 [Balneolales bacterium]|nr:hypothetical protein [Balneolales bacterium]